MKNWDVLRCDDMSDELMSENVRPWGLSLSKNKHILKEQKDNSKTILIIMSQFVSLFYGLKGEIGSQGQEVKGSQT